VEKGGQESQEWFQEQAFNKKKEANRRRCNRKKWKKYREGGEGLEAGGQRKKERGREDVGGRKDGKKRVTMKKTTRGVGGCSRVEEEGGGRGGRGRSMQVIFQKSISGYTGPQQVESREIKKTYRGSV